MAYINCRVLCITALTILIYLPYENQATPVVEGTIITEVNPDEAISQDMAEEDPFEPLNRGIFAFNQLIDGLFLKPASYILRDFFSEPVRDSVGSVIDNLSEPFTLINDLLQGEGERAGQTFARFVINTTIGVAGIFDVAAKEFGISLHKSDFGQTLGVYGVGGGFYIVIPVFGPSTLRDGIGRFAGYFADPFNLYMIKHHHDNVTYLRAGIEGIVYREKVLDLTNTFDKTADPYVQYRILYLQNRDYMIKGEKVERESPVPSDIARQE